MAKEVSLAGGINIIKERIASMQPSPGVYRMLDENGNVLYVGKARDLPKRLASYTRPNKMHYRTMNMVAATASLEIITTATDSEALLLEAGLIRKFSPKYNILLKDGKSYPYIFISGDSDFPRISKHRGPRKQKGKYYGPYPSAGAVNRAIADLQKAFLIRPCTDSYMAGRERPCMQYQIKRCSAPCVDKIDKVAYASLVDEASQFLSGKSRQVQEKLVKLMEEESAKLNFEKAASYRDRIKALNQIQARQNICVATVNNADVIGINYDGSACCIEIFFFRGGMNLGNAGFFPKHIEGAEAGEILTAFLPQFYSKNPPPPEIILPSQIEDREGMEGYLKELAGHNVKITVPKSGDRKKLIDEAQKNATARMRQKTLESSRQKELLAALAELFNIGHEITRIEVYDNSHIMGRHETGAMIVATPEGFNKKAYRRFNIKGRGAGKGDDYAMMEEVLRRRFSRLKQEYPERKPGIWPDIVLIDGGAGQLSAAQAVFDELGLTGEIFFAGIAKGPDRNAGLEDFYLPDKKPFKLPKNSPVLYYLQLLRDEAHRFAIGGHRAKRGKSVKKSVLDEIPGVGSKRKKALLNHFGSLKDIKDASTAELEKVEGISHEIAKIIWNYLR